MTASRLHWRLLVGTIVVLMAAAFLAPRWIPAPDIQENRPLAERPAWPSRWRDFRAFRKQADAYVADRFPIRPHLIGLLNRLRMMVGVSGSPRVIVGREGWLFYDDGAHLGAARNDPPMPEAEVRQWLMSLAGRTEALQARGAPYLVVAAPMKEVVHPQFGPFWYGGPDPDRSAVALPALADAAGAGEVLYLYDPIAEAARRGWKTYSRHDTHWTGYGAYAGYLGLMRRLQAMGLTDGPLPLSAFDDRGVRGHKWPRDLAKMLGVSSFVDIHHPRFGNPDGEARAKTTFLTDRQDWTAPQVLDTGEAGEPVLLMTRDSFSNEILPFLYPHFSRIVLAHNQDGFWREDLINRFDPDLVILEVVEAGLRNALQEGPAPSEAAARRIDRVLAGPEAAPRLPRLEPVGRQRLELMEAARPTGDCNIEVAGLEWDEGGGRLRVAGWLSELRPTVTSPQGLVRLHGPGGDFAAPIRLDKARPDVAAHFGIPSAGESGFAGVFRVSDLPAGAYMVGVYRRAPGGWIACLGKQPLTPA